MVRKSMAVNLSVLNSVSKKSPVTLECILDTFLLPPTLNTREDTNPSLLQNQKNTHYLEQTLLKNLAIQTVRNTNKTK
jgi:hypothetical protein